MALFYYQHRPPDYAGYVLAFAFDPWVTVDVGAYTRRIWGGWEMVEIPSGQFDFFNK